MHVLYYGLSKLFPELSSLFDRLTNMFVMCLCYRLAVSFYCDH